MSICDCSMGHVGIKFNFFEKCDSSCQTLYGEASSKDT